MHAKDRISLIPKRNRATIPEKYGDILRTSALKVLYVT